jgi:hypothetical protein
VAVCHLHAADAEAPHVDWQAVWLPFDHLEREKEN